MIAQIANKTGGRKVIIFWILAFLAILVGIMHASSLSFVNDDAFISFRYAKNLVNGFGLVYNAGERVEGYTNFLWTIIIALGMRFNIDPVPLSITLGIVFYTGTLLLFIFSSLRHNEKNSKPFLLIPLTALALSLHRDFNVYATSGLETSMFTFFVSAGFLIIIRARRLVSFFYAGMIFVLAMMTRPDGVLFFASTMIYLAVTQGKPVKKIIYFLLPSILVFVPYWLWRYSYYGFFFPNTFYAKSIDLPYYPQGLKYALLYFETYYSLFFVIPLIAIFVYRLFQNFKLEGRWKSFQITRASETSHPILLASIFIGIYTLFIIRIGGDFMHARFFIPITPLFYFIIELLIIKICSIKWNLILTTFMIGSTILRNDMFGDQLNVGYVVDEVRYYTTPFHEKEKTDGERLHKYFAGLPVRVAFGGSKLRLIYYVDPFFALEANAGLTDTVLAHQQLPNRGRPGHEKSASLSYLTDKRINFLFTPANQKPSSDIDITAIYFDSIASRIIGYDNSIMSAFDQFPDVRFIRFPRYLDNYISQMKAIPTQRVRQDYEFFKSYYFVHNADSLRENTFVSYFLQSGRPENR
jgi:hypothetical protein